MSRIPHSITYAFTHPWVTLTRLAHYILYKPRFMEYHWNAGIRDIRDITPRYIRLGKYVNIGRNARIQGIAQYNKRRFSPTIILNDGVTIQQNIHLTCANRIEIGANTAIAANVTITDIDHPYIDIDIPIERQDIIVKEVKIGPDCKIYNNAVILSGVTIGRHCVIGANSVVNRDIPDYSVVGGSPCRIIKRYDPATKCWVKTNQDGTFVSAQKI